MDPSDPNPIRVTTPRGTTSRPEPPAIYETRWRGFPPQDSHQLEAQKSPVQQQQQLGPDHYPNPPYPLSERPPADPTSGPPPSQSSAPGLGGPVVQNSQQQQSAVVGHPINQPSDGSMLQQDPQGGPNSENRRPGDPVEFNYAISYVNKIKTRFANQPEIYNSFLEILQTYHRDQLRINEVYVQVTQLFKDAPDLLDDFKQFLPDMSQQQAQQQGVGISSQKLQSIPQQPQPPMHLGVQNMPLQSVQQQQQHHHHHHLTHPGDSVRLPPVGNFSPPNVGAGSGVAPNSSNSIGPNGQASMGLAPSQAASAGRGKKRGNINAENMVHQQQQIMPAYDINGVPISNARDTINSERPRIYDDNTPLSPNLVPAIPKALDSENNVDNMELMGEITFFDKSKRFIANKQTYNEFLKVLNLFSQRIIDKDLLVERVEGFLGGNRELMNWFKDFVRYEGKPLHIENIPYKKHLLELSLCRSYGRSYRLLPKSEPYMPCSGRDEMCWEVLNDEWVGHPVWASEEAGFVAHRKNQYEEIMHRVEEERHEYDYYIEANLRSIQTLETLASRIANMQPEDKAVFKLPLNLGHTSTIYEKVLKKIYGEPRYHEVVDALRETPAVAVPIVLRRMKQKDEEWKRAHREWNKVWRDTEQKVFFKSLDHRGLTFKQTDKKYLTTRQLISEITTVKTEQSNKKISPLQPKPKEQLAYSVKDYDVLMDLLRIVMCFLSHAGTYSSNDRERMEIFFKTFLKLFFSVPEGMIHFPSDPVKPEGEEVETSVSKDEIKGDEDAKDFEGNNDVEMKDVSSKNGVSNEAESNGSKKRSHETTVDMLRDILKKSKQAKRFRDDSQNVEEEEDPEEEEEDPIKRTGNLWMKHQSSSVDLFEERHRNTYNLFANNVVYVFVRLLIILYERLEEVKSYEKVVSDEIANSRNVQFAIDLDLYDHRMASMGLAFEPQNCYGQLLNLIERLIEGDLEHQSYEESIRQAYRNRAYKLYTVDKVAQAIVKHLHNIVSDAKSSDVLVLWENDRINTLTSTKEQIIYRMRVKSVLGSDENLFRIEWNDRTHSVMIQFLSNEDITLKRKRNLEEAWNYYLTSYLMSGPTEGVPTDKVRIPFLKRNLVDESEDTESYTDEKADGDGNTSGSGADNAENNSNSDFIDEIDQGLAARIALPTFKMFFEPGTSDYFSRKVGVSSNTSTRVSEMQRKAQWDAILDSSPTGIKALDDSQAAEAQARYDAWKNDRPIVALIKESVTVTSEEIEADAGSEEKQPDQISQSESVAVDDKTGDKLDVVVTTTETVDDTKDNEEQPQSDVKDDDVVMSDLPAQPESSDISQDQSTTNASLSNQEGSHSDKEMEDVGAAATKASVVTTDTDSNDDTSMKDSDKPPSDVDVVSKDAEPGSHKENNMEATQPEIKSEDSEKSQSDEKDKDLELNDSGKDVDENESTVTETQDSDKEIKLKEEGEKSEDKKDDTSSGAAISAPAVAERADSSDDDDYTPTLNSTISIKKPGVANSAPADVQTPSHALPNTSVSSTKPEHYITSGLAKLAGADSLPPKPVASSPSSSLPSLPKAAAPPVPSSLPQSSATTASNSDSASNLDNVDLPKPKTEPEDDKSVEEENENEAKPKEETDDGNERELEKDGNENDEKSKNEDVSALLSDLISNVVDEKADEVLGTQSLSDLKKEIEEEDEEKRRNGEDEE